MLVESHYMTAHIRSSVGIQRLLLIILPASSPWSIAWSKSTNTYQYILNISWISTGKLAIFAPEAFTTQVAHMFHFYVESKYCKLNKFIIHTCQVLKLICIYRIYFDLMLLSLLSSTHTLPTDPSSSFYSQPESRVSQALPCSFPLSKAKCIYFFYSLRF